MSGYSRGIVNISHVQLMALLTLDTLWPGLILETAALRKLILETAAYGTSTFENLILKEVNLRNRSLWDVNLRKPHPEGS
jgi:hypothetical protein